MDFPVFGCVKGLFRNSVFCAKTWKTFFGVPIEEANALYFLYVVEKAELKHFLWTLHFLKCYPTECDAAARFGVTEKTWKKRVKETVAILRICLPKVYYNYVFLKKNKHLNS